MTTSIKDLICSAGTVGTNGIGAVIDPNFVYDKTKYKAKIENSYDIWTQKTSGATARSYHSAIYYNNGINNLMVIFGGYSSSSYSYLDDVWEYNLDTDVWTQKTSGATARREHLAIYYNNGINNLMVIFGGYSSSYSYLDDVWEYNLDTDIWTQKTSFITIHGHSAIYYNDGINNFVVFFGGYNNGNYSSDIWKYNLDTDTWVQKTSAILPGRSYHSAIYYNNGINNLMVIFGGYIGSGYLGDVWEYNLDTDTWVQKTSEIPRTNHSAIYYNNGTNNLMIIFGGVIQTTGYLGDVLEYNLDTDTWISKISNITTRSNHSAIYYNNGINNLMVIFGGTSTKFFKDVWEYNLDINDTWKILYPIIG